MSVLALRLNNCYSSERTENPLSFGLEQGTYMAWTAAVPCIVCVCLFLNQLQGQHWADHGCASCWLPSSPPSISWALVICAVVSSSSALAWLPTPPRQCSALYIAGVTALCTAVTLHAHKERPVSEVDQEFGSKLQILQPVHLTRWLQGGSEI